MKKRDEKKGGLKQCLVTGAGSLLLLVLQFLVQNKFGMSLGSTPADPTPASAVAPITLVVVASPADAGDKVGRERAPAQHTRNDQTTVSSYLVPLNR